jgi:hypothetical protein
MIDTTPPVSAVQPLPATVPAGPVTVNWGGTDTAPDGGAGSGVIWYEVYLSVDNGPYTIWHLASSYTSDTYTVETGHSYRFYSIACDLAGNVEAPPTNPDAATSVGLTPPTVLSASYDQNAPVSTSGGRYVAVRFSANVRDSLDLSDITITNLTTGQNITPKSMPYDDATNAAILYLGNDVPDGNYALKLYAPGIFNNVGVELDGNADGSPGGDALLPFFSFGGDANRDRVVDFNDLVKLAQNYNSSGKTWADGDFTGDGNVDFNDLVILAQHYNTSLSGAALPGPATSFSSDVAAAFALAAPKPAPIPAIPRRFTAAKPIPAVVVHPPVAKAPSPVRAAPPSPVQVAPPVFGNKRIKPRPNVQALFV